MSASDSNVSMGTEIDTSKTKQPKKKKVRKSAKPSLDVLTVLNIVDRTTLIKNDMCTKLSKPDFTKITSKHVADCSIMNKKNLAEHLLTLVALCDAIPRSSIELATSTGHTAIDTSKLESEVKSHMAELNRSNEFVFQQIQDQIKRLEDLTVTVRSHAPVSSPNQSSGPAPPAPVGHTPVPRPVASNLEVGAYIDLVENFIPVETCNALSDYVVSVDGKFQGVGGRSTIYVGQHEYSYTGKSHPAEQPPEVISDLISQINAKYPEKQVNSCLITKYVNGNSFCPPHSDDEDVIDPESNIYTLSIGAKRNMVFNARPGTSFVPTTAELSPGSLMIFSRLSQEVWQHSIPPSPGLELLRYSFTFRHIAPFFINSTVICGDSNTEKLFFGDSRTSFGKWMPGRRMGAYHVTSIPDPMDIGPHKNIVLHVGINDVKFSSDSKVPEVLGILEQKCKAIMDAFPRCNLYVCPLLPTKDTRKCSRVHSMNEGIYRLSLKYSGLLLVENYFDLFSNRMGLLRDDLGRFWEGKPADDDLHIGKVGIKMLANCIKHTVLRRKGTVEKYAIRENSNVGSTNRSRSTKPRA